MQKKILLAAFSLPLFVVGADFIVPDGSTAPRQILSGSGDTLLVEEGGTIEDIGGGSRIGVDMQAVDQTVTNDGDITANSTNNNATGVNSTSSDAVISNSGTIDVDAMLGLGYGILSDGSDATISNSGTIDVDSDDRGFGINTTGLDALINNSGTINVDVVGNVSGYGIRTDGLGAVISNSGVVNVDADGNGFGIFSVVPGAMVSNKGMINANSENGIGYGIVSIGTDATITNSGTVDVDAENGNGFGLYSFGISSMVSTISNSGTIDVDSMLGFGYGIRSDGSDTTLINSGTIDVDSNVGFGIFSLFSDATISNSGSIDVVTDGNGFGIRAEGLDATISNSGTIYVDAGGSSSGIYSIAPGFTVSNSGTIEVHATTNLRYGIFSFAADAVISNCGTIVVDAEGGNGRGIYSRALDAIITNSGTIDVLAANTSVGILSDGDNVTICNSGIINAIDGTAIQLNGDNPTLILKNGSNLQGAIELSGGAMSPILIVEGGLNLALTTGDNTWDTVTAKSKCSLAAVKGSLVAVADQSFLCTHVDVLDDLSNAILSNLEPSSCSCGSVWGNIIGSYRDRNKDKCVLGYDHRFKGVIAGINTGSTCDWDLGFFLGATWGKTRIDHSIHQSDTESKFLGVQATGCVCDHEVRVAVVAGQQKFKDTRSIMNNLVVGGKERARANYDGFFISPEVAMSFSNCVGFADVTLRYAGLFLDDYKEKGSSTNLKLKSHDIHLFNARAQLRRACSYNCLNFEPFAGVEGRFRFGDTSFKGTLIEQTITLKDHCKNSLFSLFAGTRANYAVSSCLKLNLNIEGLLDNESGKRLQGGLGLTYAY